MGVASIESAGMPGPALGPHYQTICRGFENGQVTFVLGAGASLFGRSTAHPWTGAPSGSELAERLATAFAFEGKSRDLLQVAQWAYVTAGWQPLYSELHREFEKEFQPTPLHEEIARLASRFRAAHRLRRPPLIVTTNYDDLIERAFTAANEPFDLVAYAADGPARGKFLHRPPGAPDAEFTPIDDPHQYVAQINPNERAVILKLHGFVDRTDDLGGKDSYVITEDHYIEYLTHQVDEFLPPTLVTRLKKSHLLFLGYSLRDWNLRAMIHALRIDKAQFTWWAILLNPDLLERTSWAMRQVELIDFSLEDYLAGFLSYMRGYLEA